MARIQREQTPKRRFSQILQELAEGEGKDRISVGDLVRAMQDRAFGALLLVFAFPNILPSPPGLAAVLGLPLVYLSTQMMLGQLPWLPKFIANRSMTHQNFVTVVEKGAPWLSRAELLLRQRLGVMTSAPVERLLGLVCLIIAIVLMLPIPFGNMLPSIAICLIALGVLERDGIWIIAGILGGVIAVTVVGGIGYALVKSAIFVIYNAL